MARMSGRYCTASADQEVDLPVAGTEVGHEQRRDFGIRSRNEARDGWQANVIRKDLQQQIELGHVGKRAQWSGDHLAFWRETGPRRVPETAGAHPSQRKPGDTALRRCAGLAVDKREIVQDAALRFVPVTAGDDHRRAGAIMMAAGDDPAIDDVESGSSWQQGPRQDRLHLHRIDRDL